MTVGYIDYPQGDGRQDCDRCHGRGVVQVPPERMPPNCIVPITEPCPCVRLRDIYANMERGWRGLSQVQHAKQPSPLEGKHEEDLWITGSQMALREHLARAFLVLGRTQPRFFFRVISDVDLMDAWLSKGLEDVLDGDVAERRAGQSQPEPPSRYAALVSLVGPPTLLVIRLGVKAARNVAMPEVLLEALQHRAFLDKPTWLADQPGQRLAQGHLAFDESVSVFLQGWPQHTLEGSSPSPAVSQPPVPEVAVGTIVESLDSDQEEEAETVSAPEPKQRSVTNPAYHSELGEVAEEGQKPKKYRAKKKYKKGADPT